MACGCSHIPTPRPHLEACLLAPEGGAVQRRQRSCFPLHRHKRIQLLLWVLQRPHCRLQAGEVPICYCCMHLEDLWRGRRSFGGCSCGARKGTGARQGGLAPIVRAQPNENHVHSSSCKLACAEERTCSWRGRIVRMRRGGTTKCCTVPPLLQQRRCRWPVRITSPCDLTFSFLKCEIAALACLKQSRKAKEENRSDSKWRLRTCSHRTAPHRS